jgi:signal transduction histidine kinase
MTALSLRARVFLGAILWSMGLFMFSGFALTHYMLIDPDAPNIFHRFFYRHMFLTSVSIVAFMLIGLRQVRKGLASFNELRANLGGVRDGRDARLAGEYPSEVQPLVSELNQLLEDREQRITRAHRKAGDLAHGLKTPLTLLNQQAERAKASGQVDLANAIQQQIERMRRQIDYHLAHARASASEGNPSARSHLLTSADGLARTMMTIHAEKGVRVEVHVAHEQFVRAQREDLDEMLGNLVDNACKWATSRVEIRSSSNGQTEITVDDDGPGLAAELRETVLQRGVRADEAAPGSGLGLAIVADLVELYAGSISLSSSPLGGLRATLRLPSA